MDQIDYFPVLSSLVTGELSHIRHCSDMEVARANLDRNTEIGSRDLGIDSLGLLRLASAVSQMFHLNETGVDEYLLRYRKLEDWAQIVSASLKKKAEFITFSTAGSTGKPKSCTHRISELQDEIRFHADCHSDCQRVVSFVPQHHIYGFLWTVLLPAHLDIDVVDARRWTFPRLATDILPEDLLVATPSTWQYLCRCLNDSRGPIDGVTSGAPCSASVFTDVQHIGVTLTEVYGSSETAGVASRRSPVDAFQLFPFWRKDADSSSVSRISDDSSISRTVALPDRINWVNDNHFVVSGRIDDAVQVLGANVFPQRIASLLQTHPLVKDCAVRLMDASEGNRLKAFVVLRDSQLKPNVREELSRWLQSQLQPHECPGSFAFGSELPRNGMGKLMDWKCPC